MLVQITGGSIASIQLSFINFQNSSIKYHIQNVPENVVRVSFRTQLNGWMDQQIFGYYLKEPHVSNM